MFDISLPFCCCPPGVAGAVGGVCGCAGGPLRPWVPCAVLCVCLCCVWVVFPGGGVSVRGAAVCLWGGVSGASPVVMSLSSLTVLIAASHRRLDPYWGAVFALAPCHRLAPSLRPRVDCESFDTHWVAAESSLLPFRALAYFYYMFKGGDCGNSRLPLIRPSRMLLHTSR
jgi:hypothetical protein